TSGSRAAAPERWTSVRPTSAASIAAAPTSAARASATRTWSGPTCARRATTPSTPPPTACAVPASPCRTRCCCCRRSRSKSRGPGRGAARSLLPRQQEAADLVELRARLSRERRLRQGALGGREGPLCQRRGVLARAQLVQQRDGAGDVLVSQLRR